MTRRAWVHQVMGLPVSVHARGDGVREDARLDRAVRAAFASLEDADRTFSTYRADSAVSRINAGTLAPADAGPDVAEVMRLCADAWRATGGWFDAFVRTPSGSWWDPSGVVKAWAVERAVAPLRELCDDVLVNAGGDVLGWSAHEPWVVGVEDPADRTRLLALVEVDDGALATSGTAARGAHVRDPFTGEPATGLLSVTVEGPSLLRADVLATAWLAAGREPAPADVPPGYRHLVVRAPERESAPGA